MGRIRTVKPEVFSHELLFAVESETKLPIIRAFIGMWTQCDSEGRFEWRPVRLKLAVCPYDQLDFADVLLALEKSGFIVRYIASGKTYGYIPTWRVHQPKGGKEGPSRIPEPPEPTIQAQEFTPDNTLDSPGGNWSAPDSSVTAPDLSERRVTNDEGQVTRDEGRVSRNAVSNSQVHLEPKDLKTVDAGFLSSEYLHYKRGVRSETPTAIRETMEEIIKVHDPPKVLALIRDPQRDRSELLWQFKRRLEKSVKQKTSADVQKEIREQKAREASCKTSNGTPG